MVSLKTVRRIGAAALFVPGLDHLISPTLTMVFAPTIMETMFGQGFVAATIFFIVLGLFQLTWTWVLLKSNSSSLLALGVLGNLVSILIYFISASGVTIFGVPPQRLIPFGVLIKALEAVFVLASVCVLKAARSKN
ncbi:MAG: hypothetical protein ABSD99_08850 [Candidatus Bathyarchaeia archaeon]